jgi:peptidoglycan LD-endopeptidase LytH
MSKRQVGLFLALISAGVLIAGAIWMGGRVFRRTRTAVFRLPHFFQFWDNPASHADWVLSAGQRCSDAPFIFPTDGFVGFLWDDSFRLGHRHQGLDIFGGAEPGVTPVVAAYSGYLTRRPDWKSTVAIYIPVDPLNPDRAIWTYYTHMASPDGTSFVSTDFPSGTEAVYVEAGTLLGYQGNYSGDPNNPTGVHLHFSVVQPDASGALTNELDIRNTLDPSPYFGLNVSAGRNFGEIPICP